MNKELYGRSHFISGVAGDRAYVKYLEKIRKGKNYKFYKKLSDMLWELGISSYDMTVKDILEFVDKEMNNRNAYHYEWYSSDARRAIELVLLEGFELIIK